MQTIELVSYTKDDAEIKFKNFIKAVLKILNLGNTRLPKINFSGNGFISEPIPITKVQYKNRLTKLEHLTKDYKTNKNGIWNKKESNSYAFKFTVPQDKIIYKIYYVNENENGKESNSIRFSCRFQDKKNPENEPLSIDSVRQLRNTCSEFFNKFKKFAKQKHIMLDLKLVKSNNEVSDKFIDRMYEYNFAPYFNQISNFLQDEFKNRINIEINSPNTVIGEFDKNKFTCNKGNKVSIHYIGKI